MRITITCEDCGRRHRLERGVTEAGPIWIICHDCELPLRAYLDTDRTLQTAFESTWASTLDFTTATAADAAEA